MIDLHADRSVRPSDPWWEQTELRRTRVIPTLLLSGSGFVKTRKFRKPTYLGDPINIVKIFNQKEADEIVILDIGAARERRGPNFSLLADIASECFMPLSYGGGVKTVDEMQRLTSLGYEKVCINTAAIHSPDLVRRAADQFGSSTVVVSIDAKKNYWGRYEVRVGGGLQRSGLDPVEAAVRAEDSGAGEILINSIDRDGMMQGYDLQLISRVSNAVNVPVVACGGAATVSDLRDAITEGAASAVAAGSMFVFQGPRRGVLINMPTEADMARAGIC